MKMPAKKPGWPRRYQAALCRHLMQGDAAGLKSALRLGRQAMALGLETLDVALIHERALLSAISPESSALARRRMLGRAQRFFGEAIVPLEQTHVAALKTDARVSLLSRKLHRRTLESCASARHLKQGIVRLKAAESALKKSGERHVRLLKASNVLQDRLRLRTHEMLAAQESRRQKISLRLQDEIAQTLLAIHLGLLALPATAKDGTKSIEKEIAHTQRLLSASVITIKKVAHEIANQYKPTSGGRADTSI